MATQLPTSLDPVVYQVLPVSHRQVVGSRIFSRGAGGLVGCACQIVFRWERTLHLRPNFTHRCPTSCMGRYFFLEGSRSFRGASGLWAPAGRVLTTTHRCHSHRRHQLPKGKASSQQRPIWAIQP